MIKLLNQQSNTYGKSNLNLNAKFNATQFQNYHDNSSNVNKMYASKNKLCLSIMFKEK